MASITRETVLIDRRQPALRWSAVFAGAACSVGIWLLLQLFGVGVSLLCSRGDDTTAMHTARIASTAWSLIAQVIAMCIGGMVTGRLAQTYERRIAGLHGLVMWALTSLVGVWATVWVITTITAGAEHAGGIVLDAGSEVSVQATGRALIVLGCSMAVSLITAMLGAVVALRWPRHPGDGSRRSVHTTQHGYAPPSEPVTTAPPGSPMAGPGTPVIPPRDIVP